MPLSDQQIADSIRTWKAKHYPRSLPQHLESYVQQYLDARSWYTSFEWVERIKLKNRVLAILRREGGLQGASTRKKNGVRATAKARADVLTLAQMGFSFEADHDS